MRRILLSAVCGVAITIGILICGVSEVIPKSAAKILLWPAFLLAYLLGPGPNIGTPAEPVYEGTIIDVFAFLAGMGLSVIFYSSVVYSIVGLVARGEG